MLRYPLIHPPLLAVLAAAGHGSKILLADAHYPHSTGKQPNVPLIHLNLRPGLLSVDDILEVLLTAVAIEAADVMRTAEGSVPDVASEYFAMIGESSAPGHEPSFGSLERFAFYEACMAPAVAAVVATGDQRLAANLLLTIGIAQSS
jgi:L-fucose mutarotase